MYLRALVTAFLVGWATQGLAEGMDVNLSKDAARFVYSAPFSGGSLGNAEWDVGLLFNDDDDWIVHGGLEVLGTGDPNAGLSLSAGGRAWWGSVLDDDVLALGLGGSMRYVFPSANRFALHGELFFAPSIVSFLDSEGQTDLSLQVEYGILRTAVAYIGYRRLETDLGPRGDVDVDDGIYAGMRIGF